MSSDLCTPTAEGHCPHRPGLKCSFPKDMRPFCTELEAQRRRERRTVKIHMEISTKTPGVSAQKPEKKGTSSGDCFACYPQPGRECTKCKKLVDCQVQTYIGGLRDIAIAADVRVVQARLF